MRSVLPPTMPGLTSCFGTTTWASPTSSNRATRRRLASALTSSRTVMGTSSRSTSTWTPRPSPSARTACPRVSRTLASTLQAHGGSQSASPAKTMPLHSSTPTETTPPSPRHRAHRVLEPPGMGRTQTLGMVAAMAAAATAATVTPCPSAARLRPRNRRALTPARLRASSSAPSSSRASSSSATANLRGATAPAIATGRVATR
mmetsp:Transcript_17829/g.51854  ORF Transcript_17829/g.51854 Transcript_17829/m.51854 type:complete len:203 (-) Transcript_17829:386-994(-)